MSGAVLELATGAAHDILDGDLVLPRLGVWTARAEIDADAAIAPGTDATIALARDDGGAPARFVGRVVESSVWQGRAHVVIAGGRAGLAGRLAAELPPRSYVAAPQPVPVVEIVRDICTEAGETLAPAAEAALATLVVPRWFRAAGTGAAALRELAAVVPAWRVLGDGTVWAGAETWPAAAAAATRGLYQTRDDGLTLTLDVAPEAAELVPGTVVLERPIVEVRYTFGGAFRAVLTYGAEAFAELYRATVAAARPHPVYGQAHAATVRAQHADGTLDLEVDTAAVGAITHVPLRLGLLGARVVVPEGERVRLAFENGDPSRPFAAGLDADPSADRGVARRGDRVAIRLSYAGPGALLWYPPGTPPPEPVPITATPVTIYPEIDTGSEEVLLRG